MFDQVVQRVGPRIEKQDTKMRKVLPPGLKLAITVRFLASGDKYPSLIYSFRVARNIVIWDILPGFKVACRFDSPSKAIRMFQMLLECRKNI